LHFNLSHSNGVALFAFARDYEIGVDIEKVRDIAEMEQIAIGFFSPKEYRFFRELPENMKKEAFFNCWTRKEAFIKAIGAGLSYPLNKFDVSLAPGQPARLMEIEGNSKAISRWCIQELKPTIGFVAAFAIEKCNWRLNCWHWSD
jgi:4'-phosphopantetheinyl transferase